MDNKTLAISCVNAQFCVLAKAAALSRFQIFFFFFNLQDWTLQTEVGHRSFRKKKFQQKALISLFAASEGKVKPSRNSLYTQLLMLSSAQRVKSDFSLWEICRMTKGLTFMPTALMRIRGRMKQLSLWVVSKYIVTVLFSSCY